MIRRTLTVLILLAWAAGAHAQGTATVKAVDTVSGATTEVGDAANKAFRVTLQNPLPVHVLSVDSGNNEIVASTLVTHDGATTPASATGAASFCRASAAAPTSVSADDDAVLTWCLRNGQLVAQPAFSGVLATTGNGVSGTGVQRVTIASDSTGTLIVTQGTGTNLHMVCDSGCSSSTAPADEAAFTAGTTPQSPVGGFFQTTATNNPLTTGQMGAIQLTAQRAVFSNLRNASGTEVGVAATPLQVSLANTAANGTAVKVDGSAVTQPISGTVQPGNTQNTTPWWNSVFSGTTAVTDGVNVTYWADKAGASAVGPVGGYLFNGTTWDRQRGDTTNGAYVQVKAAVQPAAPTTVSQGQKTVAVTNTAVALATTSTIKSVTAKALAANAGTVYVGGSGVTTGNGFALNPNDTVSLAIADIATVFINGTAGDGVSFITVN